VPVRLLPPCAESALPGLSLVRLLAFFFLSAVPELSAVVPIRLMPNAIYKLFDRKTDWLLICNDLCDNTCADGLATLADCEAALEFSSATGAVSLTLKVTCRLA
jgi:hypothetical protein